MSAEVDATVAESVATGLDRLEASLGSSAGVRALGVGWATVDTERAATALALSFEPAPDDTALGAACRLATRDDGVALVLIEPATEGRLAETLARVGEGPVAVWFAVPSELLEAAAGAPDRAQTGPFGRERLIAGSARDGWLVFAVDDAHLDEDEPAR